MDSDFEERIKGWGNDSKILHRLWYYKRYVHDVCMYINHENWLARVLTKDNSFEISKEDINRVIHEFSVKSKELGLSDEWIKEQISDYRRNTL